MKNKTITTQITVRFGDIDAMGHVNNAVYLTYFEEGRKAFLRDVLNITEPSEYPFILASISCNYSRPIRLDNDVSLQLWISKTGVKSFTFRYELFDPHDPSTRYGDGESVMVMYDYGKREAVPLSDAFLKMIDDYRE